MNMEEKEEVEGGESDLSPEDQALKEFAGEEVWAVLRKEKDGGEEKTSPETPDSVQSEQTPEKEEVVDPWSNLTPEQRKALEELQTNYKRVSGTVGALQKQIDQFRAQRIKEPVVVEEKRENLEEILGAVKEEYPEVIAPVERALKKLEAENQRIQSELSSISQAELEREKEEKRRILQTMHPDYREIVQSGEWRKWLGSAPSYIQNAANSSEVEDVAGVLHQFKTSFRLHQLETVKEQDALLEKKRTIQRGSSQVVPRTASVNVERGEEEDFDPVALWKRLDREAEKRRRR